MLAMSSMMQEAIEKLDTVTVISSDVVQLLLIAFVILSQRVQPLWLNPVGGSLVEDLNLVKGGDKIVAR